VLIVVGGDPFDALDFLGDTAHEKLQRGFVKDELGLFNRVRLDQVEPRHTHYYDDASCHWHRVVTPD